MTPCIQWTGPVSHDGYGREWCGRPMGYRGAHRRAYERAKGPIPKGLDLDHLCHNADPSCPGGACLHRSCINVDHLEPVTKRDHALRGLSNGAVNLRKTRCLRGHPFTPENTILHRGAQRKCRACVEQQRRERYLIEKPTRNWRDEAWYIRRKSTPASAAAHEAKP
jgi:hypothetical protein